MRMNKAMPAQTRRQAALAILGLLVVVHAGAYGVYVLRARQAALATVFRDAREQWASGHRDLAARGYAHFVSERPHATWPLVLLRSLPSEATGWFVLGRVRAEQGQTEAALNAFSHSMTLEPHVGQKEYRDLLLESHQPARLRDFALDALGKDPHSPVAHKDLGAAALTLNEPKLAVLAYQQALHDLPRFLAVTDPHRPPGLSSQEADLLNLLSVSARLAGDRVMAERACDQIHQQQPKTAHLDRLCQAYAAAAIKQVETAKALLQAYQAPAPEHDALVARLQTELHMTSAPSAAH